MPAKEPIPKSIADEAARWFAEQDSGLLDDEAALTAWLTADPRHARAFAEMEAIWSDLGAIPASPDIRRSVAPLPRHLKELGRHGSLPRMRRKWLPMAIAASIMIVAMGAASDLPTRLRADAITATGEQRTVILADGSEVMLNTHSAIAYDYRRNRRVVRLLRGEAAFTVTPDRSRPFIVQSGGGAATALGTRFVVRAGGDTTRVTVTEHRVRVTYPANRLATVDVGEGQSVTYGPKEGISTREAVNVADAAAWTQGLLVFENRPLSEVVAELARYHPGYIHLIGNDLHNRRVSGVFSIHDPLGAIEKLERSLHLRSARLTNRLVFIFA